MSLRLGETVIAGTSPRDDVSITNNTSGALQAVGVMNQNSSGTALKSWSGTKAQYDAIENKDPNTIYNVTDDSNVALSVLQTIYPVGSIYIGVMSVCPLSALFGTWTLVSSGRVLQGADENHLPGTTIEAGLPNIDSGEATVMAWYNNTSTWTQGALKKTDTTTGALVSSGQWTNTGPTKLDASQESSVYGNSDTVQPPAYVVNIWKRTE